MVFTRRAQDVANFILASKKTAKRGVFTGAYTGTPLTRIYNRWLENENR